MDTLRDKSGRSLPVVEAADNGDMYVIEGVVTVTVPANKYLMHVEAIAGEGYFWPGSSGDVPATWPPAANVTDGTATYRHVKNGQASQIRAVAVNPAQTFRLNVQAASAIQVLFT